MEIEKLIFKSSLFFESNEVRQETIVDALDFFVERLKRLSIKLDGIYPGDVYALPFTMFLSDKLGVPIKTENYIGKSDKVLVVFSAVPFELVSDRYIAEKVSIVRKLTPNSPSLLILSNSSSKYVDFQLVKGKVNRIFSYQFLREAKESFFWPTEGELTAIPGRVWELSKKEISNFLRAKRIRDAARKYLKDEEVVNLNLIDSDIDLSIWEKFKKGNLVVPFTEKNKDTKEKIPVEKLFQIKDPYLSSAVTSILEYVAQNLEYHFPTYVAYSNVEITDRRGILIIPKVTEELEGADLRVEFIVNLEKTEKRFGKIKYLIESSLLELTKDFLKKNFFVPKVESFVDEEINKGSIYLNWHIDREMAVKINRKVNKKWLLSRLLYRKQIKSELTELIKLVRNFEFNLENLEILKEKIGNIWIRNQNLFKAKSREIFSSIEQRKLWPLIGILSIKESSISEPLNFLIRLKGYENYHHLLSDLNTYYTPVLTKRIYRPNWERVIKKRIPVVLKWEPLNPDSPETYVLQTEDGMFLGVIPRKISHYVLAKERQGKEIICRELYFEPDIFSENSYWIEVECL